VDKVRENTDAITELKRNHEEMQTHMLEIQSNILKLMEGQQHILERLDLKEEISAQ
jgi:hypothetical protein